ncbi:MAG: hypothetical protein PVH19_07580 [Planctomycetia bacterium]
MEKSRTIDLTIRTIIPLVVLAVGVLGYQAIVSYCKKPPAPRPAEATGPPVVGTAPVRLQTEGLTIDADGVVVPYREITVNAEVAGRLIEKKELCRAGNYVAKGTLLMTIDPKDYDLEVKRLTKEVEQAGASIREVEVQLTNTESLIQLARDSLNLATREVKRLETLERQKVVTESELDAVRRDELLARDGLVKLENQFRVFTAQKDRLQSAKELAQVQLDRANYDLDRTHIKAPIDGMIINDYVESDAYVNRGERLFSMEDVSAVEVRCNLRMDDLFWIWDQQKASATDAEGRPVLNRSYTPPPTPTTIIYTLGGRDYMWEGTLIRYEGIGLDEATRTVPCTVVVSDPDQVRIARHPGAKPEINGWEGGSMALVRGMYVKLEIHAQPQQTLLNIPESALRPGNRVWRVRDHRLSIVPVRVVSTMSSGVIVEPVNPGDLTADDRVVIETLAVAEEGMEIRDATEVEKKKKDSSQILEPAA